MDNRENAFQYTYSAAEQSEVEAIRKKYLPQDQEENKMDRLRKLDRSASQKAQVWALSFGIIGALILGAGMSLSMSDLGAMLGLHGNLAMLIGTVTGILGLGWWQWHIRFTTGSWRRSGSGSHRRSFA